jgi:CubicO group peptidase (beta-lactamase class C family)
MSQRVLLLAALACACACDDGGETLDDYVTRRMEEGGLPGVAAAIVRDGEIAWIGAWGFADAEGGVPVDEETLFAVGSVSKTIVAVTLMQLVEEGKLDLDDAADAIVPYPVRHPEHPDLPMTIRMLATHTSGLSDDFLTLGSVTVEGDPTLSLADFGRGYVTPDGALYGRSNFGAEPGTRYDYCNAGFGLLGHVIEAASGEGFRTRTERRVFEPLGMTGSGWFLADLDPAHLAVPYTWNRRNIVPLPQQGFAYYPAGLLRTSIRDMARFALALLQGGELDGQRILDPESVDAMFGPQTDVRSRQGIAFHGDVLRRTRYVGHNGATYGGSAELLLRPEEGVAIILLSNGDGYVRAELGLPEGAQAMHDILEAVATFHDEARVGGGGF